MGYLFVGFNLVFWIIMFLVEKWESKTGRISSRKKWKKDRPQESFLYLQDWNTGSWGDLIGLSFFCYVFGQIVAPWSTMNMLIAITISFPVTYFLYSAWKGRPDSGFPDGETLSYVGWIHLVYTFLQIFVVIYLVLSVSQLSNELLMVFFIGLLIYVASFLVDYTQGKLSEEASSGM